MTGRQLHRLRTRLLDDGRWFTAGVGVTRFASVVGSTPETVLAAEDMGPLRIPAALQARLMRCCWWSVHLGAIRGEQERLHYNRQRTQLALTTERTP